MKRWDIKSEFVPGDDIVEKILLNRGIIDSKETFLAPPKISYWIDRIDSDFKASLRQASEIILDAIKNNENIIVYGDYDVDGICATAILYQAVKNGLNYDKVFHFIPNRFDNGYGLSVSSIETLLEQHKTGLIITVDSGITATSEVAFARQKGLKVIVTDHHQKPEILPEADCIVWSDKGVGSTVAWILSLMLGVKNLDHVAYTALATVTDLQPVLDFNRTILKKGLEILNSQPPFGLKKLFEIAKRSSGDVTSYDLGWVIGPRLNASGRLVDASESLNLLLETDENKALEIAQKLNEVNTTRQDKTLQMYDLASDLDENNLPKIIYSAKEDYHEGIIGLVAGKLAQKYYRPAIVVAISDGYAKGSVRSVKNINIIEILRNVEPLFESLGGHPMAAGFTIKVENLIKLELALKDLGEKYIDDIDLIKSLEIDLKIPVGIIDTSLLELVEKLEPFGIGNEEPTFCVEKVKIAATDKVGRDQNHLSIKFFSNGKSLKGIWFNAGEFATGYAVGDEVDVAFCLNRNEYNGKVYVDLMVRDVRKK